MSTHTYALLEVPKEFFDFVKEKMEEVGYGQAIIQDGDQVHIDMHGIALVVDPSDRSASKVDAKKIRKALALVKAL